MGTQDRVDRCYHQPRELGKNRTRGRSEGINNMPITVVIKIFSNKVTRRGNIYIYMYIYIRITSRISTRAVTPLNGHAVGGGVRI